MDTPASLLERLRLPSAEDAWARFVQIYTPLLFYWALRAGFQESDAADLVQDVFAQLVVKLPEFTYDRHKSFRAWLRTVTLNKGREIRRRVSVPAPLQGADLDDVAESADGNSLSGVEYRQHLVGRALRLMQAEFPAATWKACWETTACGRPAAAVAAELGISPEAVYVAKFRVLNRLRQELAGLLD